MEETTNPNPTPVMGNPITQTNEVKKTNFLLPVIFLLIIIVGAVLVFSSPKVKSLEGLGNSGQVQAVNYKDGAYDVTGSYRSPGGDESIEVKLTLKSNIITEVEVISNASNPRSQQFQERFMSGYKGMVIGKNINEVKLDKVSGSSLTSTGFNDALDKIKAQAKV